MLEHRGAAGRTTPEDAERLREQGRYLRAAGVDRALDALSGPFGVRRFVLRFQHQGGRVRVGSLEAVPLGFGGGPPPADPGQQRLSRVERALDMLHRNMSTGPRWSRGAIAYLRDAQGHTEIVPVFDEDADVVSLDDLPVPGPPGHPLEAREHQLDLERYGEALSEVHAQTRALAMDWDWWEVEDAGGLCCHWDGPPARERRHAGVVLGTWDPRPSRWTWRATGGPLLAGPAYETSQFPATFDAAMELGLLTTARLGGRWLFVGEVDDGVQLFVAVRR
jgi:hypothetical protein